MVVVAELAIEVGEVVESGCEGDLGYGVVTFAQKPAGVTQADLGDELSECLPGRPQEQPAEGCRGHVRELRHLAVPEIFRKFFEDDVADPVDAV